jgi:glycosidase
MRKNSFFLYASLVLFISCKEISQTNANIVEDVTVKEIFEIERVEPPNWWVGFKKEKLQLLMKSPEITKAVPHISYKGVTIENVSKGDSPNYLFLNLSISKETKPGKFNIVFNFENGEKKTHTYQLKARKKTAESYVGFNSSDAIYLITPDRFANGDVTNDQIEGLLEQEVNRKHDYRRHGGDIKGITDHLDYISDLGFTAIWPSPLLTNDMKEGSYHGYAMTDFYEVDPRFGTLEDYKELASKMSVKGMKLIMDLVANHCGLEHWWMKDLPFKDWVNDQENYEKNKESWSWKKTKTSNHRRTSNQDLYASKIDENEMADGWFVETMPDLNQRNPFMGTYITQNSIWWIETLGLDGIRQDTYPYPDKEFMSNWAGAIMSEYPSFSIVGEEWSYNPLLVAYWQKGTKNKDGYQSNLTSTMDFPMQSNIVQALSEKESWDKGLVKMYEGLANDFAYASPKDMMIFPDNHDMSRIFTQLKGDVVNTKMALSYLLCLPRIPQLYYGTEILMEDFAKPGDHGLIRTDFPGGWEDDSINAFTGKGLSLAQKEMQMYLKKLLNFRKKSKVIHDGKTIHFSPVKGVYFLFRILNDEVVVHIVNKNKTQVSIDLKRFSEVGLQSKTLKNVITGEQVVWGDTMNLDKRGSLLLATKK